MKGFQKKGGDILFHRMAVPSALMGLTSLFGKVRGEPHRYNHLKSVSPNSPKEEERESFLFYSP